MEADWFDLGEWASAVSAAAPVVWRWYPEADLDDIFVWSLWIYGDE